MTAEQKGWSKRRALTLWSITLGTVVLAGAVGTVITYALGVPNAYALLTATIVTALVSVLALVIVARHYSGK